MKIQESAENYLEAILMLRESRGMVRSIDIVNELKVSKPSISVAMKRLRENGYIEMDESGFITLTQAGEEIAVRIFTRHQVLTQCLIRLGVPDALARADACRVEHVISDETFARLRQHLEQAGN